MIEWYEKDNLGIYFDKIPKLVIRFAKPEDSKKQKNEIKHKPFLNTEDLKVKIVYGKLVYMFEIEAGYIWDGATIPRILWRLIGPNTSPEFLIASLIHDKLCENHAYINNDRRLSTLVFKALILESGVGKIKANIMSECVDLWQRTRGWNK